MKKKLTLSLLFMNIYFASAASINSKPLNYEPVTRSSLNKENIYLLNLTELEQADKYQLIINDNKHQFSLPPGLTKNNMRIYLPIIETLDRHLVSLSGNNQVYIEQQEIPTVVNYKDPLFVNIYDDLITQMKLVPLNKENGELANNYYYQDYEFRIQIDLNDNLYWLDPDDPDWGWVYGYTYFKIDSDNFTDKLITNTHENFKFIYIGQTDSANIYRLYTKNLNGIEITAMVDTYSQGHRLSIEKSRPSKILKINNSEEPSGDSVHVSETNKDNKPQTKAIPVYFQFDKVCEYASAFINSKISVDYTTFNQSTFTFNDKIPDTNNYDNKIELFTSAIPLGRKLNLGYLQANACYSDWQSDISLNISLIKAGITETDKIILSTQNDYVKALVSNGSNSFNLHGLACEIDDNDLSVYVKCSCLSN